MKAVIYARVSTNDQNVERQVEELRILAQAEGYSDLKFFQDTITGKSEAKIRKGYDAMLTYIQQNNITQIYCWELSRFGRSLIDIYTNIKYFRNLGINICIKKENINTKDNNANTQFQLNILASIAELELDTIKKRTISGTYNSIRKGGPGGGSIKQFGYKKQNGKLLIDPEEAAVVKDICEKYLVNDWSVLQIANYLNKSGVKTRMKKLIDNNVINYTRPSKLLWTDGSVARLLHKRLLTGYRVYGEVELQDESLRIIDNQTFDAIQLKMESKRKDNINAQKFENIFRGILVCGNCGSAMVMQKGTSKLQNHYQCFNKFSRKSEKGECSASMINIDVLNNRVYELVKDFKVDSKDVASEIQKLEAQVQLNNTAINQIQADMDGISRKEERLVELFLNEQIKSNIYESQLKSINEEIASNENKKVKIDLDNLKLRAEITELIGQKEVDLKNPILFKSNIKSLVESITVKTLNAADLDKINAMLAKEYDDVKIEGMSKRNIYYEVRIKMFDRKTVYVRIFSNSDKSLKRVIEVN